MGWIIADVCYVCMKVIDGGRMRVEQKKGKVGECSFKEEAEISYSDLARLRSLFLWREVTYTYHSCLFNLHQPLYHHYIDYQLDSLTVIAIIHLIAYIPTISDEPIETIRVFNIAYLPPRGNSLELPTALLTLNRTFLYLYT